MREKWLAAVSPQLFTSNGTSKGQLTIADSSVFKVKQEVIIGSSIAPTLELEVKRVIGPNIIYLGPKRSMVDMMSDLSAYTVADGAFIQALEQPRPKIPEEQIERATYEDEPVVARRTFLVDRFGQGYRTDNPLPVQLSDGSINIETLNANLSVQLSHKDDFPTTGDINDSVRIGDGTDELEINPDGSINVALAGIPVSEFDEANAVVSGALERVVSYVVPVGYSFALQIAEFDGDNIAKYELQVNGSVIARKHTWFSGGLSGEFVFNGSYRVSAGSTVRIMVTHSRPDPGQFSGRICGTLMEV
jgi:hypothetical protein